MISLLRRVAGLAPASLALVLFSGCSTARPSDGPGARTVWVSQVFSGGRQCDDASHYEPPDVEQMLAGAGITVLETRVEHLATCAACLVCPDYAARHFARIPAADLPKTEQTVFRAGEQPSR